MEDGFKVLSWNLGGAKYFEKKKEERKDFKDKLNTQLQSLIHFHKPDVVALQEVVEYSEPGEEKQFIIDEVAEYSCNRKILISSELHPHVHKWENVKKLGKWPEDSYLGQGLAILWKNNLRRFPMFNLPFFGAPGTPDIQLEPVSLTSGIYFGDRNTEPREALISHFMLTKPPSVPYAEVKENTFYKLPVDVFVVNTHLTTLKGEREGIPIIDEQATQRRMTQLTALMNEVVSPYNDWRRMGYKLNDSKPSQNDDIQKFNGYRATPIWILAGDFNFTEDSTEWAHLERSNFLDMNPFKGSGTKASGFGNAAILTVDYIFAGPRYEAFNPYELERAIKANLPPSGDIRVSDHFPIVASIPIARPNDEFVKNKLSVERWQAFDNQRKTGQDEEKNRTKHPGTNSTKTKIKTSATKHSTKKTSSERSGKKAGRQIKRK